MSLPGMVGVGQEEGAGVQEFDLGPPPCLFPWLWGPLSWPVTACGLEWYVSCSACKAVVGLKPRAWCVKNQQKHAEGPGARRTSTLS